MRKIIFILITGLLIINYSFASFPPVTLNARAGALGEAYVALSDDWGSLYYNPAGLSLVNKRIVGFTHLTLPESWTNVEFIGGVLPIGNITLGIGASLKNISNTGELLFPFSENSFQVSLGAKVIPNLSLGITGNLYMSTLDTESAQGFGLDLGAIYEVNPNLRLGLALYNPLSFLQWSTGTVENIERRDIVLGSFLSLNLGIPLKILFDFSLLEKPNFLNRIHLGIETNPLSMLAIRAGYNGAKEGITLGFGLSFSSFYLDYALLYTKALSNQHIISLSGSF
ncbi:MAG: hypothetical protein NZ841_03165 [Dictyoglomus sp.]|nr:hypothetical protein [Dictyoglomus sp.]MDW8188278.1 hypothetical protein [Dictyoglomus sp.]